ncbi:MAG: hypothetical protein HFJ52_00230 [Clostridia bacterium]|jgi:hypothetical protein|nr:hypothetical protein [Clostridia bacterium]
MDKIINRIYNLFKGIDITDINLAQDQELDKICNELKNLGNKAILNIENFKRELERQGLMTEKVADFIENYMRFDNES